ncbi:MAG: anaerobic ribonucleoside-triphosphate reductase activating protein [Prevotella sp.]|jgi:anaerobic ribonucleoside-triphosphate reductase activating protein|uniref:Anaerobic ribonucleoside-triphosphate reductase activating protein n=1 Tax=Segatella cerevisiae TaxID=2053716 RepID=A0ABT1BTT0_9BACT|nr:anaerobic ribonucleoside-triphosphate reductase activating protein [Segatella cerevisiae]MCH3995500.1 anaerobic ribonucleoside-triphosphate reductase activating protein [Prevotella sp.]MCI1246884.1 anaerobic ribonucleoside-triphosphate reductase activating protein [Prevotella sp.]MCO6024479.1 anaerobic ribonucleoside-triphosphate reductase activating protein [Segatella cerevisiae]
MLRYVNTGIVFQEIPDEVTLSVNISNCPIKCPGCHSSYLWKNIGTELTTEVLDEWAEKLGTDITCISFMGGDSEPEAVDRLAQYLHQKYPEYKVGWYSGRQELSDKVKKENFDFIKLGPYIRQRGGLKEKTTNQRLYKKVADGSFQDITFRFWKK